MEVELLVLCKLGIRHKEVVWREEHLHSSIGT